MQAVAQESTGDESDHEHEDLSDRIAAEENTRTAADTALDTRIDTEVTDRMAADTALGTRVDSLDHKINELEADLSTGIALSLAMQAPTVSQGKKLNLTLGAGTYNGETAVAFSFGARANKRWSVNGGLGFGARMGADT